MLTRHRITRGGMKIDRDWWFGLKLAFWIAGAVGAAYAVHLALHW